MSNSFRFRMRAFLLGLFTLVLPEDTPDIGAASWNSLNDGVAEQAAIENGKVDQPSQSKTKDESKKKKKKFDLPGAIVAAPLPTVGAAGLITNNGSSGFALGAQLFPGGKEIFRINNFLPGIGGGPRFELSKKYHVNLRADFARGKDSWTWSMGVGEAF
jgi:hypothetical protein